MSGWLCVDCAIDTYAADDYYMVDDDLWAEFGAGDLMLCTPCLENRVGRPLALGDYTEAPINDRRGM